MPDMLDVLGDRLLHLLDPSPREIPSEAPGGGPEADREGNRTKNSGRIGSVRTRGLDALGYGGHGDAVSVVDDPDSDVADTVRQYVRRAQQKGLHQPKPTGRIRLQQAFSPEAHISVNWQDVTGPYGLFDGTVGAPSAGNSVQQIAVSFPANIPSPVQLLYRYPGAMYMSVFIRSFSIQPTGTGMTGLQEVWFSDVGGATAGMGIYNPASTSSNIYQNIGALCATPMTDPGNAQIGTIFVNNIGIGGTPVSSRWQLTVTYVAFYADPWFNEQMVVPPMPAEVYEYLRTAGAQGN